MGGAYPHFYLSNASTLTASPATSARSASAGTAVCTTDGRSLAFVDVDSNSPPPPLRMRYFASPFTQYGGYKEYDFCVRVPCAVCAMCVCVLVPVLLQHHPSHPPL